MEGRHKIPGNWPDFLKVNENKKEWFHLIAAEKFPVLVVVSHNDSAYTSQDNVDVSFLIPCCHEEADIRMLLAKDGVRHGVQNIMLETVDIDVLVLCVSIEAQIGANNLWIAFSTGATLIYIDTSEIAEALGDEKYADFPMFHALTGCDVVTSFVGKGKLTA